MRKKLIFLCCLLSTFPLLSQESVVLKGSIVADSISGSFINIVNITQETGTVNNRFGEFEIEVLENDTLFFSSVQYELREVIITSDIFTSGYIEVELVESINELEEVTISDLDLTGNLKTDLSGIPVFNQGNFGFTLSDIPKLTSVERKLHTASSSSLDFLINTLNGKIKMLKKARANDDLDRLVQKGINALPLSVFLEKFAIPEEHVENFVYFCAEDPDFEKLILTDQPMELLEYYDGKAAYFLEHRMEL